MNETDSNDTVNRAGEACAHRLVVIAILSTVATVLVATFYPSGKPADDLMSLSFSATYFWIATQSFVLMLPGLLLGASIGSFAPRIGALLGACLMFSIPVVVLCDAMTFNWIAERFLSGTMSRIVTSLLPALALHVTTSSVVQGICIVAIVVVASGLIWKASGTVARKWESRKDSVQPLATTMVLSVAAVLTSFSAIRTFSRTASEMERCSTRHPFCAFHIVGYRGVGVPVPSKQGAVLSRLRGLQSIHHVHARESAQLDIQLDETSFRRDSSAESSGKASRKVIIVVVECLRPEVIDPKVMPNLHAFAQRSIYCTNNFAAGNATCQSMFSLVNGLEAVWFRRPVSEQPILNKLLHQAGYLLAFYGGQTDWTEYHMDGFINPTQFESFRIEEPDLPASDLRSIERTLQFIDEPEGRRSTTEGEALAGSPRAAICYLYATHSAFRYSDPQDRIFLPEASESVLMSHSPELRDQFYNRYKNSLRTMDRMLAPLLRDDCVVLVMGDHGEPFLDDGTAIHGTRLSRYQNMTPSMIYYPGVEPREIKVPTFHSDLLPTLLSILKLPVTDPTVFDGVDLLTASDQELATRTFVTSNFMESTSMLVGPWSADPEQPFGYRVSFDIFDWQSSYLNPIDTQGYESDEPLSAAASVKGKEVFQQWVEARFGREAVNESLSTQELFTKFFQSEDKETRFSALKIAASLPDPEDYLYELITNATRDPVAEIRNQAKDLVIRINRYRGRSQ